MACFGEQLMLRSSSISGTRIASIVVLCFVLLAGCVSRAPAAAPTVAVADASDALPSATATTESAGDIALQLCSTVGAKYAVALGAESSVPVGSFSATAAEVASWQQSRDGPAGPQPAISKSLEGLGSALVAVCYYDGNFAGVTRPPGAAAYERAELLVTADGVVIPDRFGPSDRLSVTGPTP
jgi:hypothetical protein